MMDIVFIADKRADKFWRVIILENDVVIVVVAVTPFFCC